MFIYSLVKDLTASVEKDGKEHVDDVPTQIVSEYFRFKFKNDLNESISGLRYPSVKNNGGINTTIFSSENTELEKTFELISVQKN